MFIKLHKNNRDYGAADEPFFIRLEDISVVKHKGVSGDGAYITMCGNGVYECVESVSEVMEKIAESERK